MADFTREEAIRAAVGLRAQHDIEARARDGPPSASKELRTTDMTVGEALEEIVDTMRSDKFWLELAEPVAQARTALAEGDEDGRKRAAKLLTAARDQITELRHYFAAEQQVIGRIISLLGEASVASNEVLGTVLSGVRTTISEGQATSQASAEQRAREQELSRLGADVLKQFPMNTDPWEFREVQNECQVTVTITVPAATKTGDVTVRIKPDSLLVAVKGHEAQPAIIDGRLAGPVEVEASGWSLEGSGDSRRLVLELEKRMGGLVWRQLLKP